MRNATEAGRSLREAPKRQTRNLREAQDTRCHSAAVKFTTIILIKFLGTLTRKVIRSVSVFLRIAGGVPVGNPIFYSNVVALNNETHRDLRLKTLEKPLEFARQSNLVPAIVDEFEYAVGELPIAFLPGVGNPSAVFVTGLRPSENIFITDGGLWNGRYAPAYLRRYPFIVGDVPDGESVLCIDQDFAGFGHGEGVRLFSDSGEIEEPVRKALTLAHSYRESADRTDELCAMLNEMGLFKSVTLDATLPDGEKSSMHGLLVVDEEAFANLAAEDLQKLHEKRFLRAVFFHFASLGAISALARSATDESEKMELAREIEQPKKKKKREAKTPVKH